MNCLAGFAGPAFVSVAFGRFSNDEFAATRAVFHRNSDKMQLMVPGARIELALCFQNRILNPARLPVPPPRQGKTQ